MAAYKISTYDPPDEIEGVEWVDPRHFDFEWRERCICIGVRAAAKAVHTFESQGYDRDCSIYMEKIDDVPVVH